MKYRVLQTFTYGGVQYTPGMTIELNEGEAKQFDSKMVTKIASAIKSTKDSLKKVIK